MAEISVPSQVFPGFVIISKLSDIQINNVVDYLKNFEVEILFDDIAIELSELIDNDGEELLKAIVSFSTLTDEEDVDLPILAKNLADSFKEISGFKINTKETNRLKSNLLKILINFNKLKFAYLIRSYKVENSNNFGEAKILTDIRIIPDPQNLVEDEYGAIIHKLYLEYQSARNIKELHLYISADDLIDLKNQIENAIEREKKLRETFRGNLKLI